MYGDPTAIRRLAGRLDDQALEIVGEADRLAGLAEACGWTGWAAEAMRRSNRARAAALRRSAGRHQEAADALGRHAAEVDRRLELVAAAERRIARLLDRLADLGRGSR